MSHGDLPRASTSETIPMTMGVIETDIVHFDTQADKRHPDSLGGVHGGSAATVFDSVTGCVMYSILEAGVDYDMVDLNVKMVKAAPADMPLVTVRCALHLLRTIGVPEDTFKTQDGILLVHAMVTCVIRYPQPHSPGTPDV